MAPAANPRDVIVAIVGGTMLTIVLTRPRLRWVDRLTRDSELKRRWAERSLTIFAFTMGGYAWGALFMVLHKQLGAQASAMLKGSAVFFIVYGWLVHFEPFVAEWRLNGWLGAATLYTGIAFFAVSVGAVIADSLLASFGWADARLLSITAAFAGCTWIFYKLSPRLEAFAQRL